MPAVMESLGLPGTTEGPSVVARLPLVLRWPACRVAGRGGTPGTPASHPVPPPAGAASVFFFLLAVSFFLRATLCFSAHASHRVWFGIAGSRQTRQSPSSLALSRRSLAAFLAASLCSASDCLWASRPLCPPGILSTFGGETFFSGLGFGSDLGLVFPGFVNRRRSPGFSRVGVDEGLLAGSYLPLNLAGSGTRSRKVAPTARFCGGTNPMQGRFPRPLGLSLEGEGE